MILKRLEQAGLAPKKTGNHNGGEYSSPCPWCGGDDRFQCWPEEGETGGYWCRQCGKKGDGIQLLRDLDGLSFSDACEELGVDKSDKYDAKGEWKPQRTRKEPAFVPKVVEPPVDEWQAAATEIIDHATAAIWTQEGLDALEHLRGRGLTDETIKAHRLGCSLRNSRLPPGVVIPTFAADGHILRLRVRRLHGEQPPYQLAKGSVTAPMTLGSGPIAVIVESELDAILLSQELTAGILVVGLGSAQLKPDDALHRRLMDCKLVAVALDNDQAGDKAWPWWAERYGSTARRLEPIDAKDPGEMKTNGLSMTDWINSLLGSVNLLVKHEMFVERAAIFEYENGIDRETAEFAAAASVWGGIVVNRT